nr:hypothetical protein [Tanacetum cinerariifolium]
MTEFSDKGYSVFFRGKGIKVLILNSGVNLKDISEDFQSKFESFLFVNFESVEFVMLVNRVPELVHVYFRDISSDDKCRIARSGYKCI